ncbi:MAG: hypothetical protein IKL68_02470 [Clostridia bacterium]|nr:hypothetical protein [Clostridia bacterium]
MYIIVTAKTELADAAKENGAKVYEDAQVMEPASRFEVISYDEAEVPEMYFQIFSRQLKEEPTNSEFISMMSQHIRYPVAAV